jgi:hypothetical protein
VRVATRGSETPWTGALDGRDLVLTWTPDGVSTLTTTFVPADAATYQSAASDASRQYAAQRQATARRLAALGTAQQTIGAQAAAARLAGHEAQVTAMRSAHDAKVAAMRATHDASIAAMRRRQAAARAKAAAHHH